MHQNNKVVYIRSCAFKIIDKPLSVLCCPLGIAGEAVPVAVVISHIRKSILICVLYRTIAVSLKAAARESEYFERLNISRRVINYQLISFFNLISKILFISIYCSVVMSI